MSRPLGLSLGIDFATIDRDLRSVADRIEDVGKSASIRIGGGISAGDFDAASIGASVVGIGTQLSAGIANGVRTSSSHMLQIGTRLDAMLNRFTGTAITMFQRIDDSMKFPAFAAFFTGATMKIKNFTAIWKKPLTDLDMAMGGAFGGTIAAAAKVMKVLIDTLVVSIGTAMKDAVSKVVAEFAALNGNVQRTEASASLLMTTVQKTGQVAERFPMGGKGLATSMPGPRIGKKTLGPEPIVPARPKSELLKVGAETISSIAVPAFRTLNATMLTTASIGLKVGAAFVSIPLGIITPLMKVTNWFGSLGSVSSKTFTDMYGSVKRVIPVLGLVELPIRGMRAGLGAATGAVRSLGTAFTGLGGQVLGALGIMGGIFTVVNFLKNGVKGASDLAEAVNKGKAIFGDAFGPINAQADDLSKKFGIVRKETIDVSAGFGAMATGAGFTQQKSADLAMQMTKMAADLSSSVNIPFEEAGTKIRAALSGEAEPLRKYGANILDANVKAYALATGISKSASSMTDQEKIMARAGLIMKGLSYAQNDLEITSGGAANQFRKAGGGITEFGVRIGELLLPAVTAGTVAFNEFLAIILQVFESSMPVLKSWGNTLLGVFAKAGMVVRNFWSFLEIAKLKVGEFVINSIAWIETLPQNFGPITAWLGRNWWNLLVDMLNGAKSVFTNLWTNAKALGIALWQALKGEGFDFKWTPLLEGFKATTEALPEMIKPKLISVQDDVNRIMGEIGKKEAEYAATLGAETATRPKPPEVAEAAAKEKKPKEIKLAEAVEFGSKEASSILARASSPAAQQADMAKKGLDVSRDSNATLKKIEKKLAAPTRLQEK